jgi:polysaccharide pyruvyl transferase CsaB
MGSKRIVLSGWYGNGNLGDEALLHGIVRAIRTADPSLELTVLSDNPDETHRTTGASAAPRHGKYRLLHETRALARGDLFALGGGGLVKDYGPAPGNCQRWLRPLEIAHYLRKRTATYALGIDEIRFDKSKRYVRQALKRCDLITLRDPGSAAALRELGVTGELVVTADPAVLLGDPWRPRVVQPEPLIGVNLRHWFTRGRFVDDPELVERLLGELAAALDALIDETNGRIVFIPFRESPADNDAAVCLDVRGRMRHGSRTAFAENLLTPKDAADLLASCDFVIGTRLHVLILAAASATPFFGLAYMPKVNNFIAHAGVGELHCDLNQGGEAGFLTRAIGAAFARRGEIRAQLQRTMPLLQELARLNGRLLAAQLEPKPDLRPVLKRISETNLRLEQHAATAVSLDTRLSPVRRAG